MAEIVEIKTARQKTTDEIISRLEEFLTRAKKGELIALAIVCVEPDGTAIHSYDYTARVSSLLGGIEMLKYRLLTAQEFEGSPLTEE